MQKILVLNLIPNTVGDTLMFIPVIDNIRKHLPDAQIHVTVSPQSEQLLSTVQSVDRLMVINSLAKVGKRVGWWKKVFTYITLVSHTAHMCRQERYDTCFVLLPNFALSQVIPWLGGVPRRYGYTYKGSIFSFLLTARTRFRGPFDTNEHDHHMIDSFLDILSCAAIPVTVRTVSRPVTPEEVAGAGKVLDGRKRMVVFQTGTKTITRQWPPEHFIALGQRLVRDGFTIVLLGGPRDVELNKRIAGGIGTGCIDATELLMPLRLTAGALKLATLAVGNDSGLMHLSTAVGTPAVVIFGSSTPVHSMPRGVAQCHPVYAGENAPTIMHGNIGEEGVKMMRQVSVDAVYKKIREVL